MRRLATLATLIGTFICGLAFTTASAATTSRQLNVALPEVRFDGVAIKDAIDFLRDVSGANINVNWKALEAAGVTQDTTINVRLRGVTLRKALNVVLSEAGGGDKLTFSLDEGVIDITTRELADQKLYTRVYPVDDLIMEIPDFTDAPDFTLNSTSNNSVQNPGVANGGGQGNGGGALFQTKTANTKEFKTKTERAEELVDLIKTIIQPEIWRDAGGTASIRFWNGSLIVTAPRSVHEALGGAWD